MSLAKGTALITGMACASICDTLTNRECYRDDTNSSGVALCAKYHASIECAHIVMRVESSWNRLRVLR